MNRSCLASKLLTVVAALYMGQPVYAKNRCDVDLSRVDNAFCLSDRHQTANLSYSWRLNDDRFDFASKICLTPGDQVGKRRDLVLAIDRSQSMQNLDTGRKKSGGDSLTVARSLIDLYKSDPAATGENAPKIGIVMFAGDPVCREFQSGTITVNRDFPCLYVAPRPISDTAHLDRLYQFLTQAEGKYSQQMPVASDYGIVLDLAETEALRVPSFVKTGLVLFSDARSYKGDANDPYVNLRTANYQRLQSEILTKIQRPTMRRFRMLFAMSPMPSPFFDKKGADAYDNMCAAGGAQADCDKRKIDVNNPVTWPVNNIQFTSYAQQLVQATGGAATDVVEVAGKAALDQSIEKIRIGSDEGGVIDSVAYSVDGAAQKPGTVSGNRIALQDLSVKNAQRLDVYLRASGAELKIPVQLATTKVPYDGKELADQEMVCALVPGPQNFGDAQTSGKKKQQLQGGSASCGAVLSAAGDSLSSRAALLLALAAPLAFVAFSRRRKAALVGVAAAVALAASAEAKDSEGFNVLHYRPVVGGVANSEKATPLSPGTVNAGLFLDYANDPIERGGGKERDGSVMDDLVTAHAVMAVGVANKLSLGLHLPYVHKSDLNRDLAGRKVEGGKLGRLADMSVAAKWLALEKPSFSLGVMPLVSIPTGDQELLIGDGAANYGALLAFSGQPSQLSWAFNAGYLHRQKKLVLSDESAEDVVIRGQWITSSGLEYQINSRVALGGNVQAKFSTGQGLGLSTSNPAEWLAMTKVRPLAFLELDAGFGTGLGKGVGAPDYRVFAGLAYVPGADAYRARPRAPAAKPVAQKPAQPQVGPAMIGAAAVRSSSPAATSSAAGKRSLQDATVKEAALKAGKKNAGKMTTAPQGRAKLKAKAKKK